MTIASCPASGSVNRAEPVRLIIEAIGLSIRQLREAVAAELLARRDRNT